MRFDCVFQIWNEIDTLDDWTRYRYITLMVATAAWWKEYQCFNDQHITEQLPPHVKKLLGGEIMESTFEFHALEGETPSECVSRCIQVLTRANCLYLGNQPILGTLEEAWGPTKKTDPPKSVKDTSADVNTLL